MRVALMASTCLIWIFMDCTSFRAPRVRPIEPTPSLLIPPGHRPSAGRGAMSPIPVARGEWTAATLSGRYRLVVVITLCVLLSAISGRETLLADYEDRVLTLLGDHGGRLLARIRTTDGP